METNQICGTLLVADQVTFHEDEKCFSIQHVLNRKTVPTLPSAIIVKLFIKIYFPTSDSECSLDVEVKDARNKLVFYETVGKVKNMRTNIDARPGIDTSKTSRFPVTCQGTYVFNLFADKQLLATYPLFIHSLE